MRHQPRRAELRALQRRVWGEVTYARHRAAMRARWRWSQRIGAGAIALGLASVGIGLTSPGADATPPRPDHKITLCHRTNSYTNPYVAITVDIASVKFEGHNGHDGPVFFSAIPKHEKWGDIIPPFNFGSGETYPGKNWTADGIALFNKGCNLPPVTTTTAPPTTLPTTTTTAPTTTTTAEASTTSIPPTSTTLESSTTLETSTTTASSTTTEPGSSTTTSPTASSTTVPVTVTTAGETTSTNPNATTTTLVGTVTTLGNATTTTNPSTGPLPFTGSGATALSIVGVGLIGAGLGLVRRRRSHA